MTKDNPVAAGVATLWCVNIHGPDDVIALPDYLGAVRTAKAFNDWWLAYRTAKPLHEQFDARMWAVPIEWPHDAASHASALAAPSEEYAGFRTASPVQAGIDPLVAEIEAGLEGVTPFTDADVMRYDHGGARIAILRDGERRLVADTYHEADSEHFARCSPDNIAKLIGGYRSQAERIAAQREEISHLRNLLEALAND